MCLNKPFKDRVRTKWSQWMWAWDNIPSEMIIKKCCITLDGSEDDVLFEKAIASKESADETGAFHQNEDENNLQSDIENEINDDHVAINEEFHQLFRESDTESNFEGFE